MSAEGKPQTPHLHHEQGSLVGRPLKLLTVLVARFPISVIIISALLVAVSLTGAQLSLGFRTSRSDLLNPQSENNRRWAEFTQEFGEQDDVTVVVYSKDDPKAVPPILDELAAQLSREPKLFRSVFYKYDVATLKSKGLYNDQVSLESLKQISGFLDQSQGLLQGNLASLNVGGQIAWFAQQIDRGDPRYPQAGGHLLAGQAASFGGDQGPQSKSLAILANALSGRPAPIPMEEGHLWVQVPPSISRRFRRCPLCWPVKAIGSAPVTRCSATVAVDGSD